MKNLILIILIAVLLTSCGKFSRNNDGVIIKGEIGSVLKAKQTNVMSLSDAKKIFVIKVHVGTLLFSFVDIVDGSFSLSSEEGIVTALVFLDENDQYIGTLSTQGLNLLPLCSLANGANTIIDLEALTLVGTSILPTHDPFGNEIDISEAEISSLKEVDGYFQSLAKNIDADNDSILDVLSNKELYISNRFDIPSAGHWGINDLVPHINSDALQSLIYVLEIKGGSGFYWPDSVVLSGPAGSPYQEYFTFCHSPNENGGFFSLISRKGDHSSLPFESGTYTLTIDDLTYTLDYFKVEAKNNLLFVIPTLNTNDEGKLVSIDLEYTLADGTIFNPANILTDVSVQLSDISGNQYYTTPRLVSKRIANVDFVIGLYSYTLDSPIDISELAGVGVAYCDIIGNTYIINWQ